MAFVEALPSAGAGAGSLHPLPFPKLAAAAPTICSLDPTHWHLGLRTRHLRLKHRHVSVQSPVSRQGLLPIRQGLHPEWRQIDTRIQVMESKISGLKSKTADLQSEKQRLDAAAPGDERKSLLESIRKKESDLQSERAAIQSEMQKLTADFHKGAQREYIMLRKFFLSFLYHSTRDALERDVKVRDFAKFLAETKEGVTFEFQDKGTAVPVSLTPHLCTKIAAGQRLTTANNATGTSPLAIALAIIQAPSRKHCDDPTCKREECHIVKADYEELYEIFFKQKVRVVINEKVQGKLAARFESFLTIPTSITAEVS